MGDLGPMPSNGKWQEVAGMGRKGSGGLKSREDSRR